MEKKKVKSTSIDRFAYLLALLFFLKAIVLAFWITPLWDIPDETGHFAYARNIGSGQGIPLLGKGVIDTDILSHVYGKPIDKPAMNWIAQHPPVFHIFAGIVWRIGTLLTNNVELLFRIPRIVVAFSGAATLILIYRLLRLLRIKPVVSLGIMACVSFIPMYSNLSSGTNHDTTVTLFASLAIYYWSLFLLKRRVLDAYQSAFWLSIAAATKMTTLVMLAPMVAIMIIELASPWKTRFKQAFIILTLALFLPGLWMLRHYIAFGDPFATASVVSSPRLTESLQDSFVYYVRNQPVLDHFFQNFFGLFGWIGSGKGTLHWFQIRGKPLLIYSVMALFLVLSSALILLFKTISALRESNNVLKKDSTAPVAQIQKALHKAGLLKPLGLIIVLFSGLLVVAAPIGLYRGIGLGSEIRRLLFSMLIGVFFMSFVVFIIPMKQKLKLTCYGLAVFGFFTLILLWKVYGFYLRDGRMRATHGRYFYPLIPLLIIGLIVPSIKIFKKHDWIIIGISILLGLTELITFTQQVIPLYRQF